MRNAHPRYMCYPSVVCVGRETEVTIYPEDLSRRFMPERKYELCVLALGEDFISYHDPLVMDHPYTLDGGCLKFTHTFSKEQEYSIRFRENGGAEIIVPLYAVNEDLYALRPLKGDMHSHSYYSDGQDGYIMTPADYREEGFDFFALTDHNRMYTSQLINELYEGVPLGMHMMVGEEVHTPGSTLHIVHVGGKWSVAARYIKESAAYETEVDAIEAELTNVPEYYRRKAAMAKWACDNIHAAGGMAIYAHPYWKPKNYNVSEEFSNILFEMGIFDAFELVGGIGTKSCNMQLALWQDQALKGRKLPVVGSSDSHDHDFEKGGFGRRFSVVFARENTTEAIIEAIRAGYSVAGELPGTSNSDIRFYGDLRLVTFAHFLFENYFNYTWRLCVGEGILMRRFAQSQECAEPLAMLSNSVENFYKKFYGIAPPPAIPEAHIGYLDKGLALQRVEGPETKGSAIAFRGDNGRRE
ncbi:MAG: hypothetical protein IJC56_04905 [Clostridia bacterium]|nr:hypothetical protein [Clostridia bacterium]